MATKTRSDSAPTPSRPYLEPDLPALDDESPSSPALTGSFTFSSSAEHWHWSDGMYAVHGLRHGDVVPTAALFMRHVHPDDRQLVETVMSPGRPGEAGCEYRLVDMAGIERTVTLAVSSEPDGSTTGFVVDVTRTRSRAVAEAVNGQLAQALESRAVIDQAKGVVVSTFGTDSGTAFAALAWVSQHTNVRVRLIAERIRAAASQGGLDPDMRAIIQRGLDAVLERSTSAEQGESMTARIPRGA